jgi:deazaflavin-dependent oxidoreductase (nitroreductase family)
MARELWQAAAQEREVRLTTTGRKSGKAHRVTLWIATDGRRLFIRSGQGMKRDWPQNLVASGEATLELDGRKVKVKPRRVTDHAEAREVSSLVRKKYGQAVRVSKPDEPPTPAEQATFELIPVD